MIHPTDPGRRSRSLFPVYTALTSSLLLFLFSSHKLVTWKTHLASAIVFLYQNYIHPIMLCSGSATPIPQVSICLSLLVILTKAFDEGKVCILGDRVWSWVEVLSQCLQGGTEVATGKGDRCMVTWKKVPGKNYTYGSPMKLIDLTELHYELIMEQLECCRSTLAIFITNPCPSWWLT